MAFFFLFFFPGRERCQQQPHFAQWQIKKPGFCLCFWPQPLYRGSVIVRQHVQKGFTEALWSSGKGLERAVEIHRSKFREVEPLCAVLSALHRISFQSFYPQKRSWESELLNYIVLFILVSIYTHLMSSDSSWCVTDSGSNTIEASRSDKSILLWGLLVRKTKNLYKIWLEFILQSVVRPATSQQKVLGLNLTADGGACPCGVCMTCSLEHGCFFYLYIRPLMELQPVRGRHLFPEHPQLGLAPTLKG